MRRIKSDKPSFGRVKQPEEATDAVASNARPEAQILRLVPRQADPFEAWLS
jgi:hypothetical protein